jgi:diketogulonate reductase-like aldo/keto reductase
MCRQWDGKTSAVLRRLVRRRGAVRSTLVAIGQRLSLDKHGVSIADPHPFGVLPPHRLTVAQLALAWVVRNPVVTTAMVSARVPAGIEENVGAANVALSDADVAQIEDIKSAAAGKVDVFRPFRWAIEVWD